MPGYKACRLIGTRLVAEWIRYAVAEMVVAQRALLFDIVKTHCTLIGGTKGLALK